MAKLTPEMLLRAYAVGLFPMAEHREDLTLYWIEPEKRGILPLEKFHIPRRLRRTIRSKSFEIRCNSAFGDVIRGCAAPINGRSESWINEEIISLYTDLHNMRRAHCVEVWRNDELVGGLYGVALGAAFFGESMFSIERDASKVTLVHLVARLKKSGFLLLDTQFVTNHLTQFGIVELSRAEYRQMLSSALDITAVFETDLSQPELDAFLQSTTQTS